MANPEPNAFLRVVSPQKLGEIEAQRQQEKNAVALPEEEALSPLVSRIREGFRDARDHRQSSGVSDRLISALRTYRGVYEPKKLGEIKLFGGSEVYAKVTASKCRGATAILRDLYLSASDQPWALEPTPKPTVPAEIGANITELIAAEVQTMQAQGIAVEEAVLEERFQQLYKAAQTAAFKQANEAATESTQRLNDLLVEGRFYESLREFLIDLPIFPLACLKGPVVRNYSKVRWVNGQPVKTFKPKMFWQRVSPMDLYFTPDASSIMQSDVYEHVRFTRQELFNMIGVSGYDEDVIRETLQASREGQMSTDWRDWFETERETLEDRDRFGSQKGRLIHGVEFHGCVPGQELLDFGLSKEEVPDPDAEYFVDAWLIDRKIIKVQINPSLDSRPQYYVSSFEKIPGSIYGYGLPDILEDIQNVLNATLRSIVNNLSIASGPQVVVNTDRLAPGESATNLYPWRVWQTQDDPSGNKSLPPVSFFQPNANVDQLLGVYDKFSAFADEESALPRYMTGGERASGAGRTASGLAMLMDNASKVMQSVAANIDDDVLAPALEELYELVLLTQQSDEIVRGDETVRVRGVTVAVQRETDRMRKMEFLTMTANPIDMSIIGPTGRAAVLREVADTLGMQGDKIVPSALDMENKQRDMENAAAAQQAQAGFGAPNAKPQDPRAPSEQVREPFENAGQGVVQ